MNNWKVYGKYFAKSFHHNHTNSESHEPNIHQEKLEAHKTISDGIYKVINCAMRFNGAYEYKYMTHNFSALSGTNGFIFVGTTLDLDQKEKDQVSTKDDRKRNFLDLAYVI
jgi:hypothetical protein